MDQEACKVISYHSLRKAREYRSQGNVGKAFIHFLVAVKLNPEMKNLLKEVFHNNLVDWTNNLITARRLKDVHTCFTEAIEVFPENELIHCSFGDFLLSSESVELVEEAIQCFRRCVAIDKWNLQAIRKLENSCNIAVERWHFRMLNDRARNEAFKKAIIKKVKDGYRDVLDIGTGTGLLSLFAAEAGARKIYACDSSTAMTQMAKKILNGKHVKVIENHSTDLKIPEHLPKRVSLVVCEIMDAGLLGEHVLDTLHHAWANLLKPNGTVIPQSASFHICGISSQHILDNHVLTNKPPYLGLENFEIISEEIVYDSENVSSLPGGFTELTDTVSPLDVDFNDRDDIRKVIEGKKDICVTLRCKASGILSCIAGWFSLRLTDDIVINTHPSSEVKCWDQAIFPCPYLLHVSPNQEINLLISFQNGLTQITFPDVETNKPQIKISQNAISLLNDLNYMKALESTAQHIPQTNEPCRFLDTSPFPIMALNYFRHNRRKGILVSTCRAPGDQFLVTKIADSIGISVAFTENFIENEINSSDRFDVIFLSVVDVTGEFNCFYLHQLADIRNILKPDGILLPQKIQVMGQLVESEWIRRVTRVINTEVTCSYDIASFINGFAVRHQLDFQLEALKAVHRSLPFELFTLNLLEDSNLKKDCTVAITESGQVDAIPFWFNIQFLAGKEFLTATTANSSHFNSAALLFDTQVSDSINLVSKYENGLFITEIE